MYSWGFTLTSLLIVAVTFGVTSGIPIHSDYLNAREKLIEEEQGRRLGGTVKMTAEETTLNAHILQLKKALIEDSRLNGSLFPAAISFYKAKPMIKNSPLLQLIQKMPKGAALHVHDMAIASLDWLIVNATYRDHCYMCVDKQSGFIKFRFFQTPPSNPDCPWKLVKTEREKSGNPPQFDLHLKRNVSLLATDPYDYPDISKVWERFGTYFDQLQGLIMYRPVFPDYMRRALEEFYNDNVYYIELRCMLFGIYELDGTEHTKEWAVQAYKDMADAFARDYPDWMGMKIIHTGDRFNDRLAILEQVKQSLALNAQYPDFMIGYDLVNREDTSNTLVYFMDDLLYPASLSPPKKLPFFFHAAETNWQETTVDYNLVDAVLLNATRIGHAYGLTKHPTLTTMVRDRDIPIEINPVSHQVLGLVKDLRNHPAIPLIADNFPVVISSDDPATWEALPLSHDFYMAFMAMTGERSGLGSLRQMAVNSIKYSAMTPSEKAHAMVMWQKQWDNFVSSQIEELLHNGA